MGWYGLQKWSQNYRQNSVVSRNYWLQYTQFKLNKTFAVFYSWQLFIVNTKTISWMLGMCWVNFIDCALFRFAVGRGWRCRAATFIRLHLLLICCNQVGGTLTSIHFLYNSQLETFYVLRDWIYQRWMKLYEYIAGKLSKF